MPDAEMSLTRTSTSASAARSEKEEIATTAAASSLSRTLLNAELLSQRVAKLALLLSSFRRRLGSYDACDKFMVLRRVDEYVGRGCASLSLALALSLSLATTAKHG